MKKIVLFLIVVCTCMSCSFLRKKKEAKMMQALAAAMRKQSIINGVGPFVLNKTEVTYIQALQDSLEPGLRIPVFDVVNKRTVIDSAQLVLTTQTEDSTLLWSDSTSIWNDSLYTFSSFINSIDTTFTDSTFLSDSVILADSVRAVDSVSVAYSKNITELINYFSLDETALQDSSVCPEAKVYHIDSLVVEGIPLMNIYLQFFKGKLYSFRCNAGEVFQKYLTKKYGQSVSSSTSTDVPHKDGRTVKLQETNMYWYNKTYNAHFNWSTLDGETQKGTFTLLDNALSPEWEDCHTVGGKSK